MEKPFIRKRRFFARPLRGLRLLLIWACIFQTALGCTTARVEPLTVEPAPGLAVAIRGDAPKTIFISVQNTVLPEMQPQRSLAPLLEAKGYVIVDDPEKAGYALYIDVSSYEKHTLPVGETAKGLGEVLAGAVLVPVGLLFAICELFDFDSNDEQIGLPMAGFGAGLMVDAADKSGYLMTCSLRIEERSVSSPQTAERNLRLRVVSRGAMAEDLTNLEDTLAMHVYELFP